MRPSLILLVLVFSTASAQPSVEEEIRNVLVAQQEAWITVIDAV